MWWRVALLAGADLLIVIYNVWPPLRRVLHGGAAWPDRDWPPRVLELVVVAVINAIYLRRLVRLARARRRRLESFD